MALMVRALLISMLLATAATVQAAEPVPLAPVEARFLEFLDAANAVDYVNSGLVAEYEGHDLAYWEAAVRERHAALLGSIGKLDEAKLAPADAAALAAIRVTLDDYGNPSPAVHSSIRRLSTTGRSIRTTETGFPIHRATARTCGPATR
jgi:hypothetical protein